MFTSYLPPLVSSGLTWIAMDCIGSVELVGTRLSLLPRLQLSPGLSKWNAVQSSLKEQKEEHSCKVLERKKNSRVNIRNIVGFEV